MRITTIATGDGSTVGTALGKTARRAHVADVFIWHDGTSRTATVHAITGGTHFKSIKHGRSPYHRVAHRECYAESAIISSARDRLHRHSRLSTVTVAPMLIQRSKDKVESLDTLRLGRWTRLHCVYSVRGNSSVVVLL